MPISRLSSGTIEKANSPERGGRKTSGLKPLGHDSGVAEMVLAEIILLLPANTLEGFDGFLAETKEGGGHQTFRFMKLSRWDG
jgi:hypothetical protein